MLRLIFSRQTAFGGRRTGTDPSCRLRVARGWTILFALLAVCRAVPAQPTTPATTADEPEVIGVEIANSGLDVIGDHPPNPLMTLSEEKDFNRLIRQYTTQALKSSNPSRDEENLIDQGVRYRIFRTTLEENAGNLANLSKDLVSDLEVFAGDDHPRTRAVALQSAVKYLEQLLIDQPRKVKVNAVYLLGRLTEKNERRITPIVPADMYNGVAAPLLKVATEPSQSIEMKVAALYGLGRILNDFAPPPRSLKDEISQGLIQALDQSESLPKGDGRDWLQWKIAETLGLVKEPRTLDQKPIVVDTLWKVWHDPQKQWWIRTRAFRSLTQLDLDSSFNIPLLVSEVVRLTGRLAVDYNGNPRPPIWRNSFFDMYFGMWAHEQEERDRGWGLRSQAQKNLRTHERIINGAYSAILPVINDVVSNPPGQPKPVTGSSLKSAVEWLRSNTPTDLKIHDRAIPLDLNDKPASTDATSKPPEVSATASQTALGN